MSICDGFDLAIVLLLSLGTITGFLAGFWTIFFWWFSFFLGIWVAKSATPTILAISQLHGGMAEGLLAFFLFVLTFLLVSALSRRWHRLLHYFSFPLGSSLLGMALGFTGGLLITGALAWGITLIEEFRPMVTWSRSAKYFAALAEQLPQGAFPDMEEPFIARLQAENLPASLPSTLPFVSPPEVLLESSASSSSFHWTWQLPDGMEGNCIHKFLDQIDLQLQKLFFQPSSSSSPSFKSDTIL